MPWHWQRPRTFRLLVRRTDFKRLGRLLSRPLLLRPLLSRPLYYISLTSTHFLLCIQEMGSQGCIRQAAGGREHIHGDRNKAG